MRVTFCDHLRRIYSRGSMTINQRTPKQCTLKILDARVRITSQRRCFYVTCLSDVHTTVICAVHVSLITISVGDTHKTKPIDAALFHKMNS